MRYFDFHAHIILKQLFADTPNIDSQIVKGDIGFFPGNFTDLVNIFQTQIHQSQLANFVDEEIVGVALYALERNVASEIINLDLQKLMKPTSRHKLSLTLLNDIVSNTYTPFSEFILSRTLAEYLNAPSSFNILSKNSFNSSLPKNKVNIFFVVEGCHSLVDSDNSIFPPEEVLSNLDILLSKVKIISIGITHLQQSNLCNHALGIQLTSTGPFIPKGNGFTNEGRQVVQGIFDRGIGVDLKHMSYKSRLDLRNEIDAGSYNNVQPVSCTHAGFTGIPFADWTGYITRKRQESDVFYLEIAKTMQIKNSPQRPGAAGFNMTTMNLFNEEIEWIVRNGGMIGLSMDRRIIGYVDKFDKEPTGESENSTTYVDKEYLSRAEWKALGLGTSIGNLFDADDCVAEADVEDSTEFNSQRDEYFFNHIFLHIKHYFQVCHNAGISIDVAQKHITIGSDYDGIINPFINMPTVTSMINLKKHMKQNFRHYLNVLTDSSQWESQLKDDFFEDFFYNNGFNYIKSRLK